MISLNDTNTMHEILSQVMESKRQVRIFVDGKPFDGDVVSLSSQFVEVYGYLYPEVYPHPCYTVICINSIKAISIFPEAKDKGGKR